MARKYLTDEDISDIHGPMNSVSNEDAKEWTRRKHAHETEEQQHRIKVAKKQKAKNSSKKHERKVSKHIMRTLN